MCHDPCWRVEFGKRSELREDLSSRRDLAGTARTRVEVALEILDDETLSSSSSMGSMRSRAVPQRMGSTVDDMGLHLLQEVPETTPRPVENHPDGVDVDLGDIADLPVGESLDFAQDDHAPTGF